jgi:8-oxo-dGTP pyrophosphatase MutT (NUDIX family)
VSDLDAVPISPAATVMIIRLGQDEPGDDGVPEGIHAGIPRGVPTGVPRGVEVFMLRRTLNAAFGRGMYVFPGGRVEAADGVDVELAHRLAAIRECFEEAGVLLAHTPGTLATITDGHPALAARRGVHDGSIDLLTLCAEHGLTPATEQLAWVGHWISPKGETRRFDTRFYVVPAPPGQSSVHDDNETIASLWIRPADALERQRAGELTMLPPTIANLQFLAQFDTVDDVMDAARSMPPPPTIMPKLRRDEHGKLTGVSLPGDPDFESLA